MDVVGRANASKFKSCSSPSAQESGSPQLEMGKLKKPKGYRDQSQVTFLEYRPLGESSRKSHCVIENKCMYSYNGALG